MSRRRVRTRPAAPSRAIQATETASAGPEESVCIECAERQVLDGALDVEQREQAPEEILDDEDPDERADERGDLVVHDEADRDTGEQRWWELSGTPKLDENGVFGGGLILPGIDLMLRALADHTAGLRKAPGHFQAYPTTTSDALFSGAVQAACGAIEQMRRQIRGHGPEVTCYLGGGDAAHDGGFELTAQVNVPSRGGVSPCSSSCEVSSSSGISSPSLTSWNDRALSPANRSYTGLIHAGSGTGLGLAIAKHDRLHVISRGHAAAPAHAEIEHETGEQAPGSWDR